MRSMAQKKEAALGVDPQLLPGVFLEWVDGSSLGGCRLFH